MNIVDKNGVWFQSSAAFPLNDPESKTTFWPGEPVKATETEWVKGQPAIARIESPLGEEKALEDAAAAKALEDAAAAKALEDAAAAKALEDAAAAKALEDAKAAKKATK